MIDGHIQQISSSDDQRGPIRDLGRHSDAASSEHMDRERASNLSRMQRAVDAQGAAAEHARLIRSFSSQGPADDVHLWDEQQTTSAEEGAESAHEPPDGFGAQPPWWQEMVGPRVTFT